jgi:hypothetical protein
MAAASEVVSAGAAEVRVVAGDLAASAAVVLAAAGPGAIGRIFVFMKGLL